MKCPIEKDSCLFIAVGTLNPHPSPMKIGEYHVLSIGEGGMGARRLWRQCAPIVE
jgi:hypothetical protein